MKNFPNTQLKFEPEMRVSLDKIWQFVTMPENLNEITPKSMHFKICNQSAPGVMYPGQVIVIK